MAPAVMERETDTPVVSVDVETTEGREALSREPFPPGMRPRYYNPIYPGCEMRWRATEKNEYGFKPTIQKERWDGGMYEPRNPYEEAMTRAWMVANLPGCNDPDRWKGDTHPEGREYHCQCTWHTGNHAAFEAHRRYFRHQEMMID